MPLSIDCQLIEDRLGLYHPYTVAYRAAGSQRFRDFGPHDPRDPAAIDAFARGLSWAGDRAGLSRRLEENLARLGAPPPALENARALGQPDVVAIVAGHQPSLFGGPLFLLFKLLSAIQLCAIMNRRGGMGHGIPCHRVVKSDGTVGGYAHGTKKKTELLRKEGAI